MTTKALQTAKEANAVLPTYPFWKTKAFIGSAIVLLGLAAQQFGWAHSLTPEGQDWLADGIVALLQGGGALTAFIGRLSQKAAPPVGLVGGK